MSIVLQVKQVKPQRLDVDGIRERVLDALQAEGKEVEREYEQITSGWSHRVNVETIVEISGSDASVLVGTDDKIFNFLDKGTKVRYALMSSDWKSKTKPGSMRSGGGRGHVVYIGKRKPWKSSRKRWPRPGIKARNWTPQIVKMRKPKFTRRMAQAIKLGMKRR